MTSKLKCPFCGEELDPRFDAYHETITSWVCINEKCVSFDWEFPPKAWQALIQAKHDLEQSEKCCSAWETQALDYKAETIALSGKLEIARKALKDIQWFCYAPTMGERAGRMQQRADKALETIGKHNE